MLSIALFRKILRKPYHPRNVAEMVQRGALFCRGDITKYLSHESDYKNTVIIYLSLDEMIKRIVSL